jgi:hypothetical protein
LIEDNPRLSSKINVVDSIKINGLEWTGLTTFQQWRKVFGKEDTVESDVVDIDNTDVTCEDYRVVTISYPDKVMTINWFGYTENPDDLEFLTLGAEAPEINWNLGKFKDALIVGGRAIKPDLTFGIFKEIFPLSAQQNLDALIGHERTGNQTYIVGLRSELEGCIERWVEFTFLKGKLNALALRHYFTLCSC